MNNVPENLKTDCHVLMRLLLDINIAFWLILVKLKAMLNCEMYCLAHCTNFLFILYINVVFYYSKEQIKSS